MTRKMSSTGFAVLLLASCAVANAQTTTDVFSARRIWTGNTIIENGAMVVRDGSVVAVGPESEIQLPPGAQIHDLGDAVIIPGLVIAETSLGGAAQDGERALTPEIDAAAGFEHTDYRPFEHAKWQHVADLEALELPACTASGDQLVFAWFEFAPINDADVVASVERVRLHAAQWNIGTLVRRFLCNIDEHVQFGGDNRRLFITCDAGCIRDDIGLFVGSYGILGVISEAKLKIYKAPKGFIPFSYAFDHLEHVCNAMRNVAQLGQPPSRCQ